MQFITDMIRKDIFEITTNSPMLIITASKLFSGKNNNANFEILLIDYYNTLMIKKSTDTLDEADIRILNYINENSVEDLKVLITNLEFVRQAITATVNFQLLAKLDKQNITRIANIEKEDNDLTSRLLYKLNYMANIPSYKVEDLLHYYKEYLQVNGTNFIEHSNGTDIIIDYLHDMKENDLENYKNNVLEAIPAFYKWLKYYKNKNEEMSSNDIKFLNRTRILKTKDLLELTKRDNDFLEYIISHYLLYKVLPQNVIDEIEEFADKTLSKRMKRKFNDMKEYKN